MEEHPRSRRRGRGGAGAARGAAHGAGRARRAPRRAAGRPHDDVFRRAVAVTDRHEDRAAAGHREVADPAGHAATACVPRAGWNDDDARSHDDRGTARRAGPRRPRRRRRRSSSSGRWPRTATASGAARWSAGSTRWPAGWASRLDPAAVDPAMADRILAEPRPERGARRRRRRMKLVETPARAGAAPGRRAHDGRRAGRWWWAARSSCKGDHHEAGDGLVLPADRAVLHGARRRQGTLNVAFSPGQTGRPAVGLGPGGPGRGQGLRGLDDRGRPAPVSGGCLSPTDGRVGSFVPDANLNGVAQMAVTVESDVVPRRAHDDAGHDRAALGGTRQHLAQHHLQDAARRK